MKFLPLAPMLLAIINILGAAIAHGTGGNKPSEKSGPTGVSLEQLQTSLRG